MPFRLLGDQASWKHALHIGLDQPLDAFGVGRLQTDTFFVLGRNDDLQHFNRSSILIEQGHLTLCVWLQHRTFTRVAHLGQSTQNVVRILQRRRHQSRCLVAGIAKHDALVARTLVLAIRRVDALRNVG